MGCHCLSSARTVAGRDTGVGMSRDDMLSSLGTIARSGTRKFAEAMAQVHPAILSEPRRPQSMGTHQKMNQSTGIARQLNPVWCRRAGRRQQPDRPVRRRVLLQLPRGRPRGRAVALVCGRHAVALGVLRGQPRVQGEPAVRSQPNQLLSTSLCCPTGDNSCAGRG